MRGHKVKKQRFFFPLTAVQMMQHRAVKLTTNFCSAEKEQITLSTLRTIKSTHCVNLTIRDEAVSGSESHRNSGTSAGIKTSKKKKKAADVHRRRITRRSVKVHSSRVSSDLNIPV